MAVQKRDITSIAKANWVYIALFVGLILIVVALVLVLGNKKTLPSTGGSTGGTGGSTGGTGGSTGGTDGSTGGSGGSTGGTGGSTGGTGGSTGGTGGSTGGSGGTTTPFTPTTLSPSTTNLSWSLVDADYTSAFGSTPPGALTRTSSSSTDFSDMQNRTSSLGFDAYVWDGANTYYPRKQGAPTNEDTLLVWYNGDMYCVKQTGVNWASYSPQLVSGTTYGAVIDSLKTRTDGMTACLIKGAFDPASLRTAAIANVEYNSPDRLINSRNPGEGYKTAFYGGTTFPFSYTMTSFEVPTM